MSQKCKHIGEDKKHTTLLCFVLYMKNAQFDFRTEGLNVEQVMQLC